MLYKNNNTSKLEMFLFKNPTCEYRGTPFWSWNCTLDKERLLEQIDCLKQMGFGGFHMHPRSGMATTYLSDEFMELVCACVDKAKAENMLAWLYDEDRYPSGAAGGIVTKEIPMRARHLSFTPDYEDSVSLKQSIETGKSCLLGCFDVILNEDGTLKSYTLIPPDAAAKGDKWYAYLKTAKPRGWFNDQTYIDTLNKAAIDRFIEVTYERYKSACGDSFGSTVPAIFTDEPQFARKTTLPFADSKKEVILPWTPDFADSFMDAHGFDILEKLPELIWELPNSQISNARYLFHDHTCELFTRAFSDNCGKWCGDNNIMLTGHMMEESTLKSQTAALGEAMRAYRSFQLPGIDILCNWKEYTTAKQAQSAARQYGRPGVLSELYGVTGWENDFRGHKFQGDWQAALGVTVRVHHLAWVSMKGCSKRDYPASISYQSPWYKKYPYVEDHFSRLNTALTRGTPLVDTAVIHPVESYWLHWGPSENTNAIREQLDENFKKVTEWLLFGQIDFDYISESLLPDLSTQITNELSVGKMKYKTIILPACQTLRRSTLEILDEFQKKGGTLIFMGDCPKYVDALPSDLPLDLYNRSIKIPFLRASLLEALHPSRFISIHDRDGRLTDDLIYTLRADGEDKWLFIARGKEPQNRKSVPTDKIKITLNGRFAPTLYDTINGTIEQIPYTIEKNKTIIRRTLYTHDSLLLCLSPATKSSLQKPAAPLLPARKVIDFKTALDYTREEPNVFVLDMATWALDGGQWQPLEESLRIDTAARSILSLPAADGKQAQPWVNKNEKASNFVTLKYTIQSEISVTAQLAYEEATEITLNGTQVEITPCGYYVDCDIHKINLPPLKAGTNELVITMPISKIHSIEYCYLLGDFDVEVTGCDKLIKPPRKTLAFGTITTQGMPFYGGNITYTTKIDTPDCDLRICAACYKGALISVRLDDEEIGNIVYDPYTITIKNVQSGTHTIAFTLYGNRQNTFGALHNNTNHEWIGPNYWYTKGAEWKYEYRLADTGILTSPVIEII